MNLGELEFKPEHFEYILGGAKGRLLADTISREANKILAEKLAKAPETFSDYDPRIDPDDAGDCWDGEEWVSRMVCIEKVAK